MPEPVQLIVGETPVSRVYLGPTKATSPHLAVVYATAQGDVACFEGRPMSPSQQMVSKYRTRYEVDMTDHFRTAVLGKDPLVSRDQVHQFEVMVSFAFRVDGWQGAEQWVRHGLPDALPVVDGHITALFHGAGQNFAIVDSFGLQHHLNQLCGAPMRLPEGLLVHSCRVTVRPDEKSRAFLAALEDADRRQQQGAAEHVPNKGEVQREAELRALQQQAELQARQREAAALAGAAMSVEGLIREYMIKNPGDRAGAVQMLFQWEAVRAARQEAQQDKAMELFRLMVDKDLILPGDVDAMRYQVVNQVQAAGPSVTASPALSPVPASPALPPAPVLGALPPVDWDAPLVAAPAAAPTAPVAMGKPPAPQQAGTAAAFIGAALCYLVLDESLDTACVQELNRGLSTLHDALSGSPEAFAALRLSVLGMAGDAQVRLPLDRVLPTTRTPILLQRPGLGYQQAFRTLRTVIPQDVALVKAQSGPVLRPLVFFLSGGLPMDAANWPDAHRELVDPGLHPSAPHIVACGIGAAAAGDIRRIATRPEFGYLAAPHMDPVSAAHGYTCFLRDVITGYGRRLARGAAEFTLDGPDGFFRADDAL